MEIYISLDGVLRNTIQKFDYHYKEYYLNSVEIKKVGLKSLPKNDTDNDWVVDNFDFKDEFEYDDEFEYKIITPINNDDLLNYYSFHSKKEFDNFLYIEFPVEVFGQAGLSYSNVISQLNKLIYDNPNINFTIIGLDELGKAKPSSLFFLSKNGYLGNHIKFIKTDNIKSEWESCDLWVTDNKSIIDLCPENKKVVKFETPFNQNFSCDLKINKLNEIEKLWLTSLENTTISI